MGGREKSVGLTKTDSKKYGLLCGRFQPLHLGHIGLIQLALKKCDVLYIGIGSAQDHLIGDEKNPYSYKTRSSMISECFNNEIISGKLVYFPVIDINDPPNWVSHVIKSSGIVTDNLTYFAGSNYDAYLFQEAGIDVCLLDRSNTPYKSGTDLRHMIKQSNPEWQNYTSYKIWDIIRNS